MNIESFIFAAFGVLCLFRMGMALRDWSRSLPITPDPWDAEITEKLKQPDCVAVCHHCFTPQPDNKWFCSECGASVGPYNNCLPYVYIFSEGEMLRNGLRNHLARNPLTVLGYLFVSTTEYLVFAPIYWYLFFRNLRQSTQREQDSQEDPTTLPQSPEE